MAQGAAKKTFNPNAGGKKNKRPTALGPKRGARVIAPKKTKLIAQKKLLKKHTAGLTALTEKNLAEKAGHLELLGGGKKDKKEVQGQQKGKK